MSKLKLVAMGATLLVLYPVIWVVGKLTGVGVDGLLGGGGAGGGGAGGITDDLINEEQ